MRLKTRIIVDSTADLAPEIKERVYTVPLTVHFGQEEYIDGVTIDHRTFYEKLVESDVLPTTSQATPNDFIEEFEKAKQAGEAAVVITLASKFSGTYQSAVIAASEHEKIYVVDGTSAAMGTGILAELAFRLLDAGMSAKEIADALEEEKKKIVVVALVDTLEYLKRGGRISKTAAFAGGVLNIKPVISVTDGEIHLLGKARGSKMGNNLLVQEIDEAGGIDFSKPVLLGYSGLSDALLLKYIEDSRHIWEGHLREVRYTTVGSVIGTHLGPGAVVRFVFFRKVSATVESVSLLHLVGEVVEVVSAFLFHRTELQTAVFVVHLYPADIPDGISRCSVDDKKSSVSCIFVRTPPLEVEVRDWCRLLYLQYRPMISERFLPGFGRNTVRIVLWLLGCDRPCASYCKQQACE